MRSYQIRAYIAAGWGGGWVMDEFVKLMSGSAQASYSGFTHFCGPTETLHLRLTRSLCVYLPEDLADLGWLCTNSETHDCVYAGRS